MPSPLPSDWPQLSPSLFYDDPAAAIDWLCRAFGFSVRLKVEGPNGEIEHSELVYGNALVMVSDAKRRESNASPKSVGGMNTQSLFLYVEDIEAHLARARAAGATILTELKDSDYGEEYWADRSYEARDPEGHRYWFSQRMRSATKA
jgi:uncharacterized glyoxalase superfamily protein PhnB